MPSGREEVNVPPWATHEPETTNVLAGQLVIPDAPEWKP
jgi:hypothetical protein